MNGWGNRLNWTLCNPEAEGVCLEKARCTVGGSVIKVLIAMNCYILKHTYKMLSFEVWELHALLCVCMLSFRRVEYQFDCRVA